MASRGSALMILLELSHFERTSPWATEAHAAFPSEPDSFSLELAERPLVLKVLSRFAQLSTATTCSTALDAFSHFFLGFLIGSPPQFEDSAELSGRGRKELLKDVDGLPFLGSDLKEARCRFPARELDTCWPSRAALPLHSSCAGSTWLWRL